MFSKTDNSLKENEILTADFKPEKAGELSKGNRDAKLQGSTGDTSVVYLKNTGMGNAVSYLQNKLEEKFGSLRIEEDFIADSPNHEYSSRFKRIDEAHTTIGALQVIDAKTQGEWNAMASKKNDQGKFFDAEKIAEIFQNVKPINLKFESVKLTPNGMVVIQFSPSDELKYLRKQLQDNGAKLKYSDEVTMAKTAITVGYFPNIANADKDNLDKIAKSLKDTCLEMPEYIVGGVKSGIRISSDNVSYVKFARNDLSIADSSPILESVTQKLCKQCNHYYPEALVGQREQTRQNVARI